MKEAVASRPTASILIVSYNGLRYLHACLQSVWEQLLEGDEVIVVDNASGDGSPALIRAHFPRVKLVCNTENRGFAAACNQAARLARGDVLVFLNQDTEVQKGWLDGLIAGLVLPGVGLTTSKLLLMSERDRIHLAGQDVHYTGLIFGRGFMEPAGRYMAPSLVGGVSGAAFAIRRELWERLGGFDESLFMYYEETDLSWRARLAGLGCLYTSDSVAYHDYHPSKPSALALYYSKRNRYVVLLKHWRPGTLLLLAPALLLSEIVDWGECALTGTVALRAKTRALAWLLSHLWLIGAGRRRVQQERCCSDLALLESCTWSIRPREVGGGMAGQTGAALCNFCFRLNYLAARSLLRAKEQVARLRKGMT